MTAQHTKHAKHTKLKTKKKKISTSDLDHSHSCDRCISRTYAFHSSQKTWENINKKS